MSQDIPWDFKHWGDPEDYINYDPDANYVDTLDTELLDSVRDSLVAAQDQGLIQNLESHYDGNQERDQPTHTEDRNKSMTPHRRWHSDKTKDGTEYHLVDSNIDAGVWKENGHWKMSFALDAGANYYQADLGKTRFVRKALNRAEITIMDAQIQIHQSYRDVQNVVNLAKETEDRTPEEQASIDRLEESLIMGRPDFPDPSENWLSTFQAEMREREDPIAQQPGVAAALEASDAHRTAKALLDAYFQAETRANTPVYEDRYPDVDTQTPYAAFQDHLREHPELEVLDEWKVYFQELQKDRDQDKGYEF